jgi:hypothetical protein
MQKGGDGNYPCPDVFDLTDGAMWNNKMDNILVYHRPYAQTDPQNPTCEFYSKKIRRQKVVGKKGFIVFEMFFKTRRFLFEGSDVLQRVLNENNINFNAGNKPTQQVISNEWIPYDSENDENIF